MDRRNRRRNGDLFSQRTPASRGLEHSRCRRRCGLVRLRLRSGVRACCWDFRRTGLRQGYGSLRCARYRKREAEHEGDTHAPVHPRMMISAGQHRRAKHSDFGFLQGLRETGVSTRVSRHHKGPCDRCQFRPLHRYDRTAAWV
jgi:hypothetical protein